MQGAAAGIRPGTYYDRLSAGPGPNRRRAGMYHNRPETQPADARPATEPQGNRTLGGRVPAVLHNAIVVRYAVYDSGCLLA